MAKRSGTETAAILDVAKRLDIIHEDNYQSVRPLLIQIVNMYSYLQSYSYYVQFYYVKQKHI